METSTYESKLSVERIWIAILVILGHLGVGLNVFSVSPILLESINDLDVSHGSAGLLISLPPLAAAVFGIPGGLVAVKLGQFRAFALGLLLMGAVSLSFILSDFISLLTLRLLYGVGAALILTVVGPILIQWFNSKQLLIVNSLNAAMMTIGIGISVSLGAKVSDYIGWQLSLSVLGVIPLLTLLIWIWKGNSQSSLDPDQRLPKPSEIISLIKRKAILLLLAADAGVMFQYTALSGWLPTVYTQDHGMNVQIAGLSASFLPLAGIIGVFLGGFLPLKLGSARTYLLIAGILVVIGGPATYLVENQLLISISLAIVGIGSWLYLPTLLSETMRAALFIKKDVAIVWGVMLTFTGGGMFISPVLVGYIHDISGSFTTGLIMCSVPASLLVLAGLLSSPTKNSNSTTI